MIKTAIKFLLFIATMSVPWYVLAQEVDLNDLIVVEKSAIAQASQSQQRIDNINEEIGDLRSQFRVVNAEVEGLKIYNARLRFQIRNQLQRISEIENETGKIKLLQRQLPSMMSKMLNALEEFVKRDIPFKLQERMERIANIRVVFLAPDVSLSEQLRQVLEAYRIESEYGKKIETWDSVVPIDGVEREVSMLRVGRVSFVYQTKDESRAGVWNPGTKQWEELDSLYRTSIRQGLRIARKQAAPDLMPMPIFGPVAVSN